jgi:hypothetical protein
LPSQHQLQIFDRAIKSHMMLHEKVLHIIPSVFFSCLTHVPLPPPPFSLHIIHYSSARSSAASRMIHTLWPSWSVWWGRYRPSTDPTRTMQ